MKTQANIIGRIGTIEVKDGASGKFASLSVAVNKRAKGGEGAYEDKTEWFRMTMNVKDEEKVAKSLRKGALVHFLCDMSSSVEDHGEKRVTVIKLFIREFDVLMFPKTAGGEEVEVAS